MYVTVVPCISGGVLLTRRYCFQILRGPPQPASLYNLGLLLYVRRTRSAHRSYKFANIELRRFWSFQYGYSHDRPIWLSRNISAGWEFAGLCCLPQQYSPRTQWLRKGTLWYDGDMRNRSASTQLRAPLTAILCVVGLRCGITRRRSHSSHGYRHCLGHGAGDSRARQARSPARSLGTHVPHRWRIFQPHCFLLPAADS